MPAKPSISTRLPAWLDEELRDLFRARGEGPSEGMRRVAAEWWALRTFRHIEFREGPSGRRAAIRQGPEVWEVVSVWKGYDDPEDFRDHFGWLSEEALREAIDFYGRFPEDIDRWIRENERFAEYLAS